jgi:hypothetical protein
VQVLDDEEDVSDKKGSQQDDAPDSQSPLPTKRRPAKRQLLEDSDDDFECARASKAVACKATGDDPVSVASLFAPRAAGLATVAHHVHRQGWQHSNNVAVLTPMPHAAAEEQAVRNPLQDAREKQPDSTEKGQAASPAAVSAPADAMIAGAEDGVSELPAPVKAEPRPAGAENAESGQNMHPEYGLPPHPDAEITIVGSKAFWQYINDKGEEVMVVCFQHSLSMCCWSAGFMQLLSRQPGMSACCTYEARRCTSEVQYQLSPSM